MSEQLSAVAPHESLKSLSRSGVMAGCAIAIALLPAAAVAANGGYFPSSWGWVALAFAWLALILIEFRPYAFVAGRTMVGALGLLTVWSLFSSMWAIDGAASVDVSLRLLAILLGVLAFFAFVGVFDLTWFFVTSVIGIAAICAYALLTRLLADQLGRPDALGGYRLSRPVGYWNGLGIYAVIGLAIAVGAVAHLRRAQRMIMSGAIPVFAVTAYFTYSRGAATAFGFALVVIFVVDPLRLEWLSRALLTAAPCVIGVLVASQSSALTTAGVGNDRVASEGHRLAGLLVLLCVASVGIAAIPRREFVLPSRFRTAVTAGVSIVGVLVISAGLAAAGGPTGVWDKFASPPPKVHGDLNKRLFSFSGNYRTPLWAQAVNEAKAHPIIGGGAGSYETYYLQHRTQPAKARNAHSLYLETLAELGAVGLGILLVALLSPAWALPRARGHPLVPALSGAYGAFLIHMAVDWDWQLTGVALAGLFCGAGIVAASSTERRDRSSPRDRRTLAGVALVGAVAAFVMLVGNLELSKATAAAGQGNWNASARDARRAKTWAPWSSEPYRLLGEAQLGLGQSKAAAASFRSSIAKSPRDWNLWFDLARSTFGNEQRAALNRAARLNPLSPEIAEFRRELAQERTITVAPDRS